MQYNLRKTKYVTIGTIPKSNIEIVERGNIDTTNIQIHYHSLSWLGTGPHSPNTIHDRPLPWFGTGPHSPNTIHDAHFIGLVQAHTALTQYMTLTSLVWYRPTQP